MNSAPSGGIFIPVAPGAELAGRPSKVSPKTNERCPLRVTVRRGHGAVVRVASPLRPKRGRTARAGRTHVGGFDLVGVRSRRHRRVVSQAVRRAEDRQRPLHGRRAAHAVRCLRLRRLLGAIFDEARHTITAWLATSRCRGLLSPALDQVEMWASPDGRVLKPRDVASGPAFCGTI